MRIVIITDAWEPQVNGVVRTYQNITRELKNLGHECLIISPNDFASIPCPAYREINLSLFPYRKLSSMIDAYRPDGIHIAVEGPLGWAARRYCLKHNKPFTTSFHTHFPDYIAKRSPAFLKGWSRKKTINVLREFHQSAKAIYVATQSLEDELRSWGFNNTMIRMTRGVDTSVFHPPSTQKKDIDGLPTLIYVGRVSVEKNLEDFLDLDIPSKKIIVGTGPSLESLQKKYPSAVFAGLKQGKALADYYRQGDCFVFPSKTDTFGIVLIEALACGLPIAGYNVTGPRDIVTHPNLGAVHDDLKTAIMNALDAPGSARDRHEHIRQTYSWEKVAKTFAMPHESP